MQNNMKLCLKILFQTYKNYDKKLQAHIAVLLANIFFGINYITIKFIVPSQEKKYDWIKLVATILIFSGVYLANYRQKFI